MDDNEKGVWVVLRVRWGEVGEGGVGLPRRTEAALCPASPAIITEGSPAVINRTSVSSRSYQARVTAALPLHSGPRFTLASLPLQPLSSLLSITALHLFVILHIDLFLLHLAFHRSSLMFPSCFLNNTMLTFCAPSQLHLSLLLQE